ncbi:universal stress protein [Mycolicibacterium moriokaense]|uniref:Universal stress protein n=1 Tax=Mycolicibacterium moriokaense TaxID=39691 RepID=A0AAD1HE92_9MYCO|nr:universal stress protein [Mycolicibacterium moriokaense]MCV7040468.1 universal stress protein [Mycolicibacterium moriokaense]ORB15111.1 universal stress protein [Mycolicibacterium moriokaense]BBX03419.1 universal stress protein [Mycolicibacterium moriokaense]
MSSPKYGILVGVDGSPESEAAIRWATHEAVLHNQPVTLLHAIPPVVVSWPVAYLETSFAEAQEHFAREVLDKAQKTVQASVGEAQPPDVRTEVMHVDPPSALATASRDAYMTVAGSRGLGAISRTILGSVSGGLLHHGHGPIVIIPTDQAPADSSAPVLLGVDGSPASEDATALAFDEASRRGVDLVALHAWSDVGVFPVLGMDWHKYEEEGHEVLGERLAGWQEQYPDVHIQRRIVCDQPARWLIEESEKAQLVVLGSHGRGGLAGMLVGSVSSKVAQASKAPVIVVRARHGSK